MKILISTIFILILSISSIKTNYKAGAGIYDITGPAADVGMMGYAMLYQRTAGIHFRLRSRAFIIADVETADLLTYINLDLCYASFALKDTVVKELEKTHPGVFSHGNVMMSGTHTHSGPGGYSWYSMYDLTSFGFQHENFNAIVDGIVHSVLMAYRNLQDANLVIVSGDLSEPMTNINRSPTAYKNNPESEKAKYKFDVDKDIYTLRFEDANGNGFAAINWFPVHGTSMNNLNFLISGDNKGYASYLFERKLNGNFSTGKGKFISAFGQCNEGDVSPNTKGAMCDNGDPCEVAHSTCGGRSEGCHSYGPGKDDFESTKIIGTQQFDMAWKLYQSSGKVLSGDLRNVHTFLPMTDQIVSKKFTGLDKDVKTCIAALGDSFAAGTTDGPGDFDFTQGTNDSSVNPYWNFLGHFLADPPKEQIDCHYPKPILLYPGGVNYPTPWVAHTLPIQMFKVGDLFLIAVPGEFTTMSGRRLRESLQNQLIELGVATKESIFIISGLANSYSQYITTKEEYNIQRYEGASTLYGPHTLAYYIQEYTKLAEYLAENKPAPAGPNPGDYSKEVIDLLPPHLFDDGPIGKVLTPPKSSYSKGETAEVIFHSGNPRNNLRTQDTFLTVEYKEGGNWTVVATDGDVETKFYWNRHFSIQLEESYATIQWDIPTWTPSGTYRIRHFCDGKTIFSGKITPYVGTSPEFTVQ